MKVRDQIFLGLMVLVLIRLGTRMHWGVPSSQSSAQVADAPSSSAAKPAFTVARAAAVRDTFNAMSTHERAGIFADLLASDEIGATKLLLTLLQHNLSDNEREGILDALGDRPHHPALLLPAVLPWADRSTLLASHVDKVALAFADQGTLSASLMRAQREAWAQRFRAGFAASQKREPTPASFWDTSYQSQRSDTGVLLDLFGHLPKGWFGDEIAKATQLGDTDIAVFAVRAQLRHGIQPDAHVLERIATQAASRDTLWQVLDDADRVGLMPDVYNSDLFRAEARLANWLAHPAELGRPPDAMEYVKLVFAKSPEDGKERAHYVFRFKSRKFAKRGWMGGVCRCRKRARCRPDGLSIHAFAR